MECFIDLIRPVEREERAAKINHDLEWYGNSSACSQCEKEEDRKNHPDRRRNEYLIAELEEGPEHVEVAEVAEPFHSLIAEDVKFPCALNSHS